MRSISKATASSTGGRPRRWGYVHFLAIRRRCQRRIVPGVTKRCPRSICGKPGRARRTPLDPPSPGAASGWLCAARRLHGAAPGARRPWTPTSGRATTAGSAPEEDQVEQTQRHGARSCPVAGHTNLPGQRRRPTSGTPQVCGFPPELWAASCLAKAARDVASFSRPIVGDDGHSRRPTPRALGRGGAYDVVFDPGDLGHVSVWR